MSQSFFCISNVTGDINTVRFLLAAGAEVDQRSATGQTVLHLAVLAANLPIVQLLLEHGADFQVNSFDAWEKLNNTFAQPGNRTQDLLLSSRACRH